MNKSEAIELLKQTLNEIPVLRELQRDNQKFELWRDRIRNIIKAALDSDDLKRFSFAQPIPMKGLHPNGIYQQYYLDKLTGYETALKSIIDKYEMLGIEEKPVAIAGLPPKAFISHGKESIALSKVEKFLRELGIEPLIVKDKPTLDKDLPDKVNSYLGQADFVVILATGDDEVEGKLQPRQNVIHEIGLAQKTHAGKIIYLLEEKAEFPSNIRPKVYEPFTQENMEKAYLRIAIELRAFGVLKAVKPQAIKGA